MIRDKAARDRAERESRPVSRGEAYYGRAEYGRAESRFERRVWLVVELMLWALAAVVVVFLAWVIRFILASPKV